MICRGERRCKSCRRWIEISKRKIGRFVWAKLASPARSTRNFDPPPTLFRNYGALAVAESRPPQKGKQAHPLTISCSLTGRRDQPSSRTGDTVDPALFRPLRLFTETNENGQTQLWSLTVLIRLFDYPKTPRLRPMQGYISQST